MIYLALPALISLIIKTMILWGVRKTVETSKSHIFIGLITVAIIHNLVEITGLWMLTVGVNPEYIFRVYYALLLFLAAYISLYCLQVSSLKYSIISIYLVICSIVGVLLMFPGIIIDGYTSISYSITAIHGRFYVVFRGAILLYLCSSLFFLISGYIKTEDRLTRVRCIFTGIALSPIFAVGFGVLALQAIGVQINAMMAVPIATTFFIIFMVKTERTHKLTDIHLYIPWSNEWNLARRLLAVFSDYTLNRKTVKESVTEIEIMLIRYKLNRYDYNICRTSKSMGLPTSTLYSRCKTLDIPIKRQDKKQ